MLSKHKQGGEQMKHLNPEKLAREELKVYNDAYEKFTRHETYKMHKEPMRSHLQMQYAQFHTECYIKYKNNRRGPYQHWDRPGHGNKSGET